MNSSPLLFSGSSHPDLAKEIATLLKVPLGKILLEHFPDKEMFIEILEPVQQRHVYVIQSLAFNPNEYLMELLIILDALKRAAVASITVVMPYYAYARQDRVNKPGVSITAKLVANLLVKAGATALLTLDLHSEQIEGFFDIPVEQILSRSVLVAHCSDLNLEETVVVAPDNGGIKIASAYAKQLGVPMALIDKERIDAFRVQMNVFVGDVNGRTVILPDDMCSTASTIVYAAKTCARLGAKRIIAVIGHGLFIGKALENIDNSPIEIVLTTNSVPLSESVLKHSKIRSVSIAPLFAEAIYKTSPFWIH